jgi:RNA polymerase sigma-70 factor (ECF subfamily)
MKSQEGVPMGAALAAIPVAEASEGVSRLFREHHRRVLFAAYRITGNMADAEDVAQSVFLRLATGNSLAPANAGSYLYRAAINGALDLLRGRKAAAFEPLELIAEEAPTPPGSAPDAKMRIKELRAWLRLAISELAPRAAEMFALRYLEELNIQEIAACMNTSRAVVAVTLHQARAKLKKRLSELERGKQCDKATSHF